MNLSPETEKRISFTKSPPHDGKRWICTSLGLFKCVLLVAAAGSLAASASEAPFPSSGGGGKKTFFPYSLLWKKSHPQCYVGKIAGTPLPPQSPWAAITQLSTVYWNNRLFILNPISNAIMVSFYIYTVLFIPEDPKMFQLLMGSSCLIADSMTAQRCRAGVEKSSASSRNYRGNSGRWNRITRIAISPRRLGLTSRCSQNVALNNSEGIHLLTNREKCLWIFLQLAQLKSKLKIIIKPVPHSSFIKTVFVPRYCWAY